MKPAIVAMILAGSALQDSAPRVLPRAITPTSWEISGAVEAADRTELIVRARRVERKWDSKLLKFSESPSDEGMLRAHAVAGGKKFEASLKPGTPGRYAVIVEVERKALYTERVALGAVEPLFARGPEHAKRIIDLRNKAVDFLDEIERIANGNHGKQVPTQEQFVKRANEVETKLVELRGSCDLTATVRVLLDVMHHIRYAQLWEAKPAPEDGDKDPPPAKDQLFMDESMNLARLRKAIKGVPEMLSDEIRVSTALILERLFAQAGEETRRGDEARAAARAASKFAEAAPVRDAEFGRLLDEAADPASDPTLLRGRLKTTAQAHLVTP